MKTLESPRLFQFFEWFSHIFQWQACIHFSWLLRWIDRTDLPVFYNDFNRLLHWLINPHFMLFRCDFIIVVNPIPSKKTRFMNYSITSPNLNILWCYKKEIKIQTHRRYILLCFSKSIMFLLCFFILHVYISTKYNIVYIFS